jgi:hypothetical protein
MFPPLSHGDYAQYLLHADALLHGRSYTDIGYIFSETRAQVGPRAQPPGLPLTLVPLLAAVGADHAALRMLMVGSALAFLVIAGIYFWRRMGPGAGLAVPAMVGVALESNYVSASVISDLGFAALLWGTIAAADADGPWTRRRVVAVTLLGLGAMAYRIPGVVLVPAMLGYALLAPREQRRLAIVPFAVWSLILLVGAAVVARGLPLADLLGTGPYSLLVRAARYAMHYPQLVMQAYLYPFAGNLANDVLHAAMALLAAVGLGGFIWRERRSFLVLFAACYALALIVAPVKEPRYAWPLFPLLVAGFVEGLSMVLLRVRPAVGRTRAQVAGFAAAALVAVAAAAREAARPAPATLLGHADVQALFAELRAMHQREPMRAIFANPRVLTWETGIPAMAPIGHSTTRTIDEIRDKRISHMVVGEYGLFPPEIAATMRRTVDEHRTLFTEVYRNPTYTVYRFVDPAIVARHVGAR